MQRLVLRLGLPFLLVVSLLVLVFATARADSPKAGASGALFGQFGYTGASTTDDLAIFDLGTNLALSGTLDLLPEGNYPYDGTINPYRPEVWIAGASGDGVVVVDTISNTIAQRIANVGDYPVDVAFSKDGAHAYVSARNDDAIHIVDTGSYTITATIPISVGYSVSAGKMVVDACTGDLYAVDWYDDNFFKIDPETQTVVEDFDAGTSLWDLVMSPDMSTIYVTDRGSDQVHALSTDPLTVTASVDVGDDPWGIDITPDGSLLFVANEDDGTVQVIETASLTVRETITPTTDADPRDVDISEDGAFAYVPSGSISGDDAVFVIDTSSWQVTETITVAPAANPNVVAVAPPPASLDPIANFDMNSPVTLGTPVVFTDTTLNDPTSWFWDFGDDLGTSTAQHPSYNYGNPGTYTVTLSVENRCGTDIYMDTVEVLPLSTATATSAPPTETPTATPPQPTATATSVPTATATASATPTMTATATSPAPTATMTTTVTVTATSPAATATATAPAATATVTAPPASATVTVTVTTTPSGEREIYLPLVVK